MVSSSTPIPLLYHLPPQRVEEATVLFQEEVEKAPQLLYKQGLALLEEGSQKNSVAILLKGAQKFDLALQLEPSFWEAYHAWARALFLVFMIRGSLKDLEKARQKIEKAPLLNAEICWDAALIYQKLAEFSGELDDHHKAVLYFEKSIEQGPMEESVFWSSCAKAHTSLAEKSRSKHPSMKGIAYYKKALNLSLSNFDAWLGLAINLQKLFFFSQENEYFVQACDCFAAASQLEPQKLEVWKERISFILEVARQKKDLSKVRRAAEVCEKAPCSPHIEGLWAEALALLGSWTSDIEMLGEAKKKIDKVLDSEDDPFLINQNGKCLASFAHYYHDLDLYYLAIQEFQISISTDRTQLTPWVWMGATYAQVHTFTEEMGDLENSLYFYSKALQMSYNPHFYYELAVLLIKLGDAQDHHEFIEEAISYLEYLLHTYPAMSLENPEWLFHYGVALDIQGSIKEDPAILHKALDALVQALMLNPLYPRIHHQFGIVYCHLGDVLEEPDYLYRSLHHYKLAQQTVVEDEELLIDWGVTWIHLSPLVQDKEACFKEAEQKLMEAAQLGSETVFYNLACLYSLKQLYPRALSYLQKSHATKNLPSREEIMEDEWLCNLRLSPHFQEFLALLPENW